MHRYFSIGKLTFFLNYILSEPLYIRWVVFDLVCDKVRDSKSHYEVLLLIELPDVTLVKGVPFNECVHCWVVLREKVLQLKSGKKDDNVDDGH